MPGRSLVRQLAAALASLGALAGNAASQSVLLQLKPKAGDTLRVRLDQTVEMVGTMRSADGESSTSESSTLVVLTRLAVEGADPGGATLVAFTDSVRLTTPANSATGTMLAWARAIEGQRFRFRVAPDGSTSLGEGWGARAGAMITQMPATLPRKPVAPGNVWSSSMEVPLASTLATRGTATLTATFRFDSLSKSGHHAYLSIQGRLTRQASGARGPGGTVIETSGSLRGHVVVDRHRGWITDARTTVNVYSLVAPAGGKPPMRVRMVITQWMRVL
jgi:hypothetical protein